MTRPVTERDFRMPEFQNANPEDYEIRGDGKPARKDRWQMGIRAIAGILGWSRKEFEVPEVVEAIRDLVELNRARSKSLDVHKAEYERIYDLIDGLSCACSENARRALDPAPELLPNEEGA